MAIENANVTPDLPPLLPPPRQVTYLDGTTALSADVRLATRDVLPFMRKGMRGIFTAAEIRVVANKKKFVIQVNIVDESDVDLSDIPRPLQKDAYELEILDNHVTISSASQIGAAWGVQTFADIYTSAGADAVIPNVKIRDWSSLPMRAFYVPCTPAVERMRYDEFTEIVNRIARAKCDLIGLELFHQQLSPGPDYKVVTDTLLVPIGEEEQPEEQKKHYSWIDPESGSESHHDGLPPLLEAQGINKLIAFVMGKGVEFMPGLSFPGKSKLLPVLFPEVRGKDVNGEDAQDVCCLSNDEARQAFEKIIDIIFDLCSEMPPQYFLLNLNSVPPLNDPRHWCQCEICKTKEPETIVAEFSAWFAATVRAKGGRQTVISQTDSHIAGQLLAGQFFEVLQAANLTEAVILRGGVNAAAHGFSVLTPVVTAFGAGEGFAGNTQALLNRAKDAVANATRGFLADTSPEADSLCLESVMALHGWTGVTENSVEETLDYVSKAIVPVAADVFNKVTVNLAEAVSHTNMTAALLKYYAAATDLSGIELVGKVLEAVDNHGELENLGEALHAAAKITASTGKKLNELIEKLTPPPPAKEDETPLPPPAFLTSLRGEAEFVAAIAEYFITALDHKKEVDKQEKMGAEAVNAFKKASAKLQSRMVEIEKNKPRYAAAADVCVLSRILAR